MPLIKRAFGENDYDHQDYQCQKILGSVGVEIDESKHHTSQLSRLIEICTFTAISSLLEFFRRRRIVPREFFSSQVVVI